MTRTIAHNTPGGTRSAIAKDRCSSSSQNYLSGDNDRPSHTTTTSSSVQFSQCRVTAESSTLAESSSATTGENVGPELDILTRFDFDATFGPHLGITRIQRWERARRLGLRPPFEVLRTLLDVELEMLGRFDLDVRFGPYLGISRVERFERAERLGLKPPTEIGNILLSSASECGFENSGCAAGFRMP